jgi:hypothetical protein
MKITPKEICWITAFFLPIIFILILMRWLTTNILYIWDPIVLATITALVTVSAFILIKALPQKRDTLLSLYDLIWILMAGVGVISLGWKQAEYFADTNIKNYSEIIDLSEKSIMRKADHWLPIVESEATQFVGNRTLIPEIKALIANDRAYLSLNVSNFLISSKSPKYSSFNAIKAQEELVKAIDFKNYYIEERTKASRLKTEKGTPLFVTLLGAFYIALGLGLRLAKALADFLKTICIKLPL